MTVHCEHDGPLGVLRLARPEKANAYDDGMLSAFEAGLDALLADETVRVLLIEAAGEGAFCGGADLVAMSAASPLDALDLRSQRLFDRLATAPKVSLVAIHGAAIAGGFELCMACDLRVAGPGARFSLPETALGLIPSAGGCTRLTRLLGPARSKAIILGGREIDAATALAWGLVDRVAADPRSQARAWATRISRRDPVALRLAKAVIDQQDTRSSLAAERLSEAVLYALRQRDGSR